MPGCCCCGAGTTLLLEKEMMVSSYVVGSGNNQDISIIDLLVCLVRKNMYICGEKMPCYNKNVVSATVTQRGGVLLFWGNIKLMTRIWFGIKG